MEYLKVEILGMCILATIGFVSIYFERKERRTEAEKRQLANDEKMELPKL